MVENQDARSCVHMNTVTNTTVRHRLTRSLLVGAVALIAGSGLASRAGAQGFAPHDRTASSSGDSGSGYRVLLGEKATYDVEYKGHGVGTGSLEVLGRESAGGFTTYHAAMRLQAGFLLARVNEQMDSWFDPHRYFTRRFSQN